MYIILDFFIEKRYLLRKRITPNWNVKFSSLLYDGQLIVDNQSHLNISRLECRVF
nr:MAG TPA: hypothetical protein [Caudoviricetes sp.]